MCVSVQDWVFSALTPGRVAGRREGKGDSVDGPCLSRKLGFPTRPLEVKGEGQEVPMVIELPPANQQAAVRPGRSP